MTATKLTVRVFQSESGFTAVCQEFGVSGSGDSQEDAIECLVLALRATLAASAASLRDDPSSLSEMATIFQTVYENEKPRLTP